MSSIPLEHGPVFVGHWLRMGIVQWVQMVGAGAWGMALAVVGIWVLSGSELPGFLGGLSVVERGLVGVGMLSGGQLVFLLFVAERIFVLTPRRLTGAVHWWSLVLGGVCFVLFIFGRMFFGVA